MDGVSLEAVGVSSLALQGPSWVHTRDDDSFCDTTRSHDALLEQRLALPLLMARLLLVSMLLLCLALTAMAGKIAKAPTQRILPAPTPLKTGPTKC